MTEDLVRQLVNNILEMKNQIKVLEDLQKQNLEMIKQLQLRLDESQEIAQIRSTNYNPNLDDN